MSKPIALVSISNPEDMQVPPLGILCVGGALKKKGYDVRVFHIPANNMEAHVNQIVNLDPLFIGFSVITGNQTKHSAMLSKLFKEKCNIPLVWGGIHPSLVPKQTISESYVDYICIGEGEITAVDLAKALEGKKKLNSVKGIAYKENAEIKFNAPRPLAKNIDEFFPDYELIDLNKHLEAQYGCKRILTLVTSRGCVFNCAFCYNKRFNEGRWRAQSAEKVIKEIKPLIEKYNVDGVRFFDDYFFANQERAWKIIEAFGLPWYAELRTNIITPHLVQKLIKTKCNEVMLGLESGSNRVLKLMNKHQTVDTIRNAIKLLKEAKDTRVMGSFIFSAPTETREEVYQTIDFILELNKIHPNMRFSAGFYLPYPGSDMYDTVVKMGFKPPQKTEEWVMLDRWSDRLKLTWSDWMQDSSYFRQIRDYVNLLPLKDTNLPILKNLPEKRLIKKDFSHPIELKLLRYFQHKFAVKGSLTRKIGYKILPYLRGK